ncbi:hypothetical protein Glove_750g45 [Diversispora epigaea]|uniref:Uncharacterized protein n=1 Tax=Diversispora epigaea TaxID=1348612 RepID=A0A397G3P9_9GLOM|nr:hypothetical protein Glove_750g45 [Diversispora epigaea]
MRCWDAQVTRRPTFKELNRECKELNSELPIYTSRPLNYSVFQNPRMKKRSGLCCRGYKQPCGECKKELIPKLLKEESIEEVRRSQKEEIKRTLRIESSIQEGETIIEESMEIIVDLKTTKKRLKEQIEQLKEKQKKLEEKLIYLQKINKEKRELVEKTICNKEVSIFHCKDCKEVENDYEYCLQSIINIYKAFYFNKETIRKGKEEELKKYQRLFEETFKEKQNETKIIMIEGSREAGKSTFVRKCKEYLIKYRKIVEILNESFITKDHSGRIINYESNLKKYKENKITKEQMKTIVKRKNFSQKKNKEKLVKTTNIDYEDLEYYRNLDEVYKEFMLEIYSNLKVITKEIQLTKEQKGEALELKALQILRAQNIIMNILKAHLLKETKKGTRFKQIIGDGGIDLFGKITI